MKKTLLISDKQLSIFDQAESVQAKNRISPVDNKKPQKPIKTTATFIKSVEKIDKVHLHIFTDGASKGNPGPSAIGIIIKDENGKVFLDKGFFIGKQTNNVAEFSAAFYALSYALELQKNMIIEKISFLSDSELLIKALKGIYLMKNEPLSSIKKEVLILAKKLNVSIDFIHVLRAQNAEADAAANRGVKSKELPEAQILEKLKKLFPI